MTTSLESGAEGRASFGTANLHPERTGLSFIVFISQRDDARHAARVKVSPTPRVRADAMGAYAIAPFGYQAGWRLASDEEKALAHWARSAATFSKPAGPAQSEYTGHALERLVPV